MIAPLSQAEFIDQHWERKSLMLSGEHDRARFTDLFEMKDIGRLLHYLKPSPPEGMLLVKGSEHYASRWTNSDGTPQPKYVRMAIQEGYSMIINGIDKLWEPVERFTHALQADLHHPVDVNLYVTPPSSQAFSYHWDIMDVFILQVEGTKAWQVYEAAFDRPFPDEHAQISDDQLPPKVFDLELQPGDMLYIPRGHVHAARTTDSTSMHLSVGIHPKTWIDLFCAAVQAARSDDRFRGALTPGYFNAESLHQKFSELAEALPDLLSSDRALDHLAQDWFVSHQPPPNDDFMDGNPNLQATTTVSIRDGVICRLIDGPGYAGIQYTGGRIVGPAKIGSALKNIVQKRSFVLSALDNTLTEREVMVLVNRLIRDGLLQIESQEKTDG